MLKSWIKYGLIFAGGAGIGGGVCYVVLKKKFEKDMEEHDAEIRDYFKNMYLEARKAADTYFTESDDVVDDEEEPERAVRDLDNNTEDSEVDESGRRVNFTEEQNRRKSLLAEKMGYEHNSYRTRYDLVSKPDLEEENETEEVVDEVTLNVNNDNPAHDIYVINADQFAHEKYGYDKVTLYWWELERILTEEDLDILDVPDLLGYDWENHIGEFEKDIVYVRNENLETDYEVVVQHESFYEMRG